MKFPFEMVPARFHGTFFHFPGEGGVCALSSQTSKLPYGKAVFSGGLLTADRSAARSPCNRTRVASLRHDPFESESWVTNQ